MADKFYSKNDIIDDRYVVQEILGAGSFSVVYKVLDSLIGEVFALKVFKEGSDVLSRLRDEFKILSRLSHNYVAKIFDAGQLKDKTYFLKLEYVEGDTLQELIKNKSISFGKARKLIEQLLEAISYLHSQKVMHRDIKPNNLIDGIDGLVIVDFNISKLVESYASSRVGTPRYQPPEVNVHGWNWTGDLYSTGLVLYEMLTGKYPFSDSTPPALSSPEDPRKYNANITDGLASVVLRAIHPDPSNRYQSAEDMWKDLERIDWRPIRKITGDIDLSGIQISPEEHTKPNYNPYLSRLLTLYSQSKLTNSGTRGLDDFARATYIETQLDTVLKPAIKSGDFPLVIITGNAGDGKTAFIQKLEEEIYHDSNTDHFETLPSNNGSKFVYHGRTYFTNYDGSQDEGDLNNDDVLRTFFEPFQGDTPYEHNDLVHVIAINEGRLIDFLQTNETEYRFLYSQVRDFFERELAIGENLLIVNLNLRSVVANGGDDYSIFDHMVDRMTAPIMWESCNGCDIADRCYAKFNADSFSNPVYGGQLRRRLKSLFQTAHLRQRLHITIRDLRSALAFTLFGTKDCDGIHEMLQDSSTSEVFLSSYYYNASFEYERPILPSSDRLISLLSEVDPGRVANPKLDSHLAFTAPNKLNNIPPFDDRGIYDVDLVYALFTNVRDIYQSMSVENIVNNSDDYAQHLAHLYHASLRRKIFFESTSEDWRSMLPYKHFTEFLEIVTNPTQEKLEEVRNRIVHAVSLSENIYHDEIGRNFLCLTTGQESKVTIKSFRRFHQSHFRCSVREIGELENYIEYIPSTIIFEYTRDASVRMEINLDLFEMLHRIIDGYTPSLNELRGSYINLLIFKRQLASTPYDEILLTEDERQFYRVFQEDTSHKLKLSEVR